MDEKEKKKPLFQGIIRASPGYYGKGGKKLTKDNIVVLKKDSDPTKLQMTTPIAIYEPAKTKRISYDNILSIIVAFLILTLILIKFVFNQFFITNTEKNLEQLISNFCFAFIASFIFYLLVVKRREVVRNRETYAVICGLTESLISHGTNILNLMAKGANKEEEIRKIKKLDIDIIESLCSQADLTKIIDGNKLDIGGLIILSGVKKVNYFIEKIYRYMPFLDGEYVKRINRIQNSSFYREITILPEKREYNLNGFGTDILEYINLLDDLGAYNKTLKIKYLKGYKVSY